MNKRSVIIMMIVPSVVTLVIGIFLMVATYSRDPDDQSGLVYIGDVLYLGGLFFLSVIVTIVFLLIGKSKLRKLRKSGKSS